MVARALTYEEIALADPSHALELHDGRLREKPELTDSHHVVLQRLDRQLTPQLDFDVYDIRINLTRLRYDDEHYYIPDLAVIRVPGSLPLVERSGRLEVMNVPVPLLAESWSPSTGVFDVLEKLPKYKERGDEEIWLIHPFERKVEAWRRQPDGEYSYEIFHGGTVQLHAISGVTIDLDRLFA